MSQESDAIEGIAMAISDTLVSPNEADRNLEPANVVDGLFYIGRTLDRLAAAVERLVPESVLPAEVYREMAPPDRKQSAYHNPPGES